MTADDSDATGFSGRVNARREALVDLPVGGRTGDLLVPCVIDTGFTAELALPEEVVTDLGLRYTGLVRGRLADGSLINIPKYDAEVRWFGGLRRVWVSAVSGRNALIGTELLDGHRLTIDYAARSVEVV